jgi:hypothetical protein
MPIGHQIVHGGEAFDMVWFLRLGFGCSLVVTAF